MQLGKVQVDRHRQGFSSSRGQPTVDRHNMYALPDEKCPQMAAYKDVTLVKYPFPKTVCLDCCAHPASTRTPCPDS